VHDCLSLVVSVVSVQLMFDTVFGAVFIYTANRSDDGVVIFHGRLLLGRACVNESERLYSVVDWELRFI
jgi:hypothetical protein